MEKRVFQILSAVFFTLILSGIPTRAEAGQRVDPAWVRAVALDQCVPDNEPLSGSCAAEFSFCIAEFERMVNGTSFTFCRGTNPELCNMVEEDVYEYSNKGYGMLIASAIDRFFWTDPSVREARGCPDKKKAVIFQDHRAAYVYSSSSVSVATSYVRPEFAVANQPISVIVGPQPPSPEVNPAPVEETNPPPAQDQAPPQEAAQTAPSHTAEDVVERQDPRAQMSNQKEIQEPEGQEVPTGSISEKLVSEPNELDSALDAEAFSAGCSLHLTGTPTQGIHSLMALLVLGIPFLGWKRK